MGVRRNFLTYNLQRDRQLMYRKITTEFISRRTDFGVSDYCTFCKEESSEDNLSVASFPSLLMSHDSFQVQGVADKEFTHAFASFKEIEKSQPKEIKPNLQSFQKVTHQKPPNKQILTLPQAILEKYKTPKKQRPEPSPNEHRALIEKFKNKAAHIDDDILSISTLDTIPRNFA